MTAIVQVEPNLETVATWCSRGLTAYDASYVPVAEEAGVRLVTADTGILEVDAEHSVLLSNWPA